jgi:hypothetical protein
MELRDCPDSVFLINCLQPAGGDHQTEQLILADWFLRPVLLHQRDEAGAGPAVVASVPIVFSGTRKSTCPSQKLMNSFLKSSIYGFS